MKGFIFPPTVNFREFTSSVLPISSIIPHCEHIKFFFLVSDFPSNLTCRMVHCFYSFFQELEVWLQHLFIIFRFLQEVHLVECLIYLDLTPPSLAVLQVVSLPPSSPIKMMRTGFYLQALRCATFHLSASWLFLSWCAIGLSFSVKLLSSPFACKWKF